MGVARFLKGLTLTITRDTGGGYYDDSGQWVDSSATSLSSFDIKCSIQPGNKKGKNQVVLPEGITTNDIQVVYTQTEITTGEQVGLTLADTTEIDGFTYVAFFSENWARHTSLQNIHYKVTFIRQDKLPNGSL